MLDSPQPNYVSLLQVAKTRYSCRAFLPQPVPRAEIDRILAVAEMTPSDCNSQPWEVFFASGPALERLRAELLAAAGGQEPATTDVPPIAKYTGLYQDRRRACGWALYEAVGVTKGDRVASGKQAMENFRFFGAPNVAIFTSPKSLGERGLFDTGIYLGHFLLAAQSLGIGAVPQGAISHYAAVIRRHLPIPEELQIICGVAFGYSDTGHAANSFRTTRAPRDEYAHFAE